MMEEHAMDERASDASAAARIRRLIEDGALPLEDGLRLLEAYEMAEARDRAIRQELRHIRARSRRHGAAKIMAIGLALIGLGILVGAAVLRPAWRGDAGLAGSGAAREAAEANTRVAEELEGLELDQVIRELEATLRRPGAAEDYRKLGVAYGLRHERSGAQEDLDRSAEALGRADRLERRSVMRGSSSVFGILFVLLIVTAVAVSIMLMYNSLARRDEGVNERWAQVETVLQRRLDLIPPLVETVQGYAAHERQTLLAVTEARGRMLGMLKGSEGSPPASSELLDDLGEAQGELEGALGRLLALAEQYPDLKASENFVTLQDQLEGTENRIAVERQRYNESVRVYNTRIRVFPFNVVGDMFGYEQREYFESRLGAEEPVHVGL